MIFALGVLIVGICIGFLYGKLFGFLFIGVIMMICSIANHYGKPK